MGPENQVGPRGRLKRCWPLGAETAVPARQHFLRMALSPPMPPAPRRQAERRQRVNHLPSFPPEATAIFTQIMEYERSVCPVTLQRLARSDSTVQRRATPVERRTNIPLRNVPASEPRLRARKTCLLVLTRPAAPMQTCFSYRQRIYQVHGRTGRTYTPGSNICWHADGGRVAGSLTTQARQRAAQHLPHIRSTHGPYDGANGVGSARPAAFCYRRLFSLSGRCGANDRCRSARAKDPTLSAPPFCLRHTPYL